MINLTTGNARLQVNVKASGGLDIFAADGGVMGQGGNTCSVSLSQEEGKRLLEYLKAAYEEA